MHRRRNRSQYDSSSQCDEDKFTKSRPAWKEDKIDKLSVSPQSDYIVTHVNQTADLERAKLFSAVPSKGQTSEEWLLNHSIEYQKITLKDLLQKGRQVKKAGQGRHLIFDATAITEIEFKLNMSIESYHKRVKWLLEGSKKMFGLVKGERVGVLIDSSDANTGFGRLQAFQQSLLNLVDEQLKVKKSLYFLRFGTDCEKLWNNPRDINLRTLEEAKDFVKGLHPSGGCNLLQAFKDILKVKKLNSIIIIIGNCPDQTSTVLFDYVQQCLLGRDLPIHAVAYDTSNHMTHQTLEKLAEHSNGRYHCFNSSDDREVYKSFDIQLLLKEAQRCVDVISKIKQMRTGMLGDALISIENEIALEVDNLSAARFLPRPPNHHQPLSIETPTFHPLTSAEWLTNNELRAQNLNLYQILAPNSFDPVQEFIPILGKAVESKILGIAMQRFEWHDGSMKNVHVDVRMLESYQEKLGAIVKKYERRVEWLSSASRRIWGTICEKRVIFLIDTSLSNQPYMIHLQHSLRLILEQQMANKQAFNIIAFGSHPKMWKPHMVKPTIENLQSAWNWVLNLQASGSRSVMSVLRHCVENDEDTKKFGGPQGIYLIGSGIPDQQEEVVCSYASEVCIGSPIKVHSILFSIDDYNVNESNMPSRYSTVQQTADYLRNLAHATGGRFHWFKESGIIESDDVLLLTMEMERAVHYAQRCAQLIEQVKDKDVRNKEEIAARKQHELEQYNIPTIKPWKRNEITEYIEPRPTALSLARANRREAESVKSVKWKVPTKKALLPPAPYKDSSEPDSTQTPTRQKKASKTQSEPFYVEQRNNVGSVFRKFPKQRSVRKAVPEPVLPQVEEYLSSREWMKKYSLNKLKLNLDKYVSGPVCCHEKSKVKSSKSNVTSKWFCSIFPSVEIEGHIRHIDMKEKELLDYEKHVNTAMRRYLLRLQWLLSGSRKTFGTILEKNVVILIDTSGSMNVYLEELKKEMTSLIWEQLHKNKINFNLISYSNGIKQWQESVTEANETTCHDAVQWTASLNAEGGTSTLEALEAAFSDRDVEGVYLLSDGKPDTSFKLTLERVEEINTEKLPVHSISFNCDNQGANGFLKKLSVATGGRYHRCHGEMDAQFAAHRLINDGCLDEDYINLPAFEGDDLKRINNEVTKARKFLTESRSFRGVITDHQLTSTGGTNINGEPYNNKEGRPISSKPFLPY